MSGNSSFFTSSRTVGRAIPAWVISPWRNIGNAAYPATNCAERTAMFKAVSEGNTDFRAIAIVGGPKGKEPKDFCAPCGVCRQVMAEFCDPETFRIVLMNGDGEIRDYLLKELLPLGFTGKALEK